MRRRFNDSGRRRPGNATPGGTICGWRRLLDSLEVRQLLTAIAVPDSYRVIQDNALAAPGFGVLANDRISSENALSVVSNTAPAHGTVLLGADGSFTYTPAPGYSGADAFDYTATDGLGHNASATVGLTVAAAPAEAGVLAGSRLASIDSARSALLNGVLGGLLGTGLTVNAVDWNALASGEIAAAPVVEAVRTNLGLATTGEALDANVTLAQAFGAAASAAQADGNTALVQALNSLQAQVGGLTGTIKLGDLLGVDPNDGSLAAASLNALDLATGEIQLFNFKNVATTPSPATVSGSALGLQSVLNSVQISAQVVEPPVYVRGGVGTQFHTAAVRLKLNLDIVDLNPNTSALVAALSSLGAVTADVSLGQLELYVDLASGSGTLTAINAIGRAVTLQGTPGVADAYLGSISDAAFSNRSRAIVPATDLGYGTVGNLGVRVAEPIIGTVLADVTAGIQLRSAALGQAPLTNSLTYIAPFPETQTIGSSAAFLSNLLSTLTSNLQVQLNGSLGALLDPLVNGVVVPTLKPIVAGAVAPVLGTVLTSVVDPALRAVGVGIGELVATVDAIGVRSGPLANNDFATAAEDTPTTIPVLSNDARVAGEVVTVGSVSQPAHGTVVINPDGTVTYFPAANYSGLDSFTYSITDGVNGSTSATVTVQVTPVNDAPVARADAYAATEDTPLVVAGPGVLANDTDADGDPLTAALVSGPAHGTLALSPDGSFTYTPAANYSGPDSFAYRAGDGASFSAPVTVTLTVGAVNDAPVAGPVAYQATEDTPLVISAPGLLSNASDPDGDPLTASVISGPAHGTLALDPDGSFTYTPAANYSGPDSFTFQAGDGAALSAPVTVTLTVGAVNSTPVALLDIFQTGSNTPLVVAAPGVLANDTDSDGSPLTAVLATSPAHGSLQLNADGSFTYTPDPDYVGLDSFTYRAGDGTALSGPVTVLLPVLAANRAPVAGFDLYMAARDGTLTVAASGGVLANDSDPDGGGLQARLTRAPASGRVTLNPEGSFSYTPNPGFVGTDFFSYRASDGRADSAETVVAIGVAVSPSAREAPTVTDGIITVPGNPGDIVRIRFDWTFRAARDNDEIGFYRVDDASGTIDGVAPGSKSYRALALNSTGRTVIFHSGERAGAAREFDLRGGDRIALYLVHGATTARAIAGRAGVYFAQTAANLDGIRHAQDQETADRPTIISWEDLKHGGDRDFDDVVMTVALAGGSVPSPKDAAIRVAGAAGAPVTTRFTLTQSGKASRDEIGRFEVDDASGRIGTLTPGDPGYLQAALARGNRDTLFAAGSKSTRTAVRVTEGGSYYGFYLVVNGTIDQVQAGKKKDVYLSFSSANPDRFSHVQLAGDRLYAFDDRRGGGNRDFQDPFVKVEYF